MTWGRAVAAFLLLAAAAVAVLLLLRPPMPVLQLVGKKSPPSQQLPLATAVQSLDKAGAVIGAPHSLEKVLQGMASEGVLVNFWATWCAPCLEELPSLVALATQMKAKDGKEHVLLVSVDEDPAAVRRLFATLPYAVTALSVSDRTSVLAQAVAVVKFPESIWTAADGTVRFRWIGPQDWLSEDTLRTLHWLGATGPAKEQ